MKRLFVCALLSVLAVTGSEMYGRNVEGARKALAQDPPKRVIKTGTEKIIPLSRNGKVCVDIIVAKKAPAVTKIAADELQKYLSASLGGKVAIRQTAIKGRTAIYVGDNPELRKLGIEPDKMWSESFIIRNVGNDRIFIAGKDHPKHFPRTVGFDGDRGTLFGVYDFLERFAGIRFYFPGEIGTIIPKHGELVLPEINIFDRPDFSRRRILAGRPAKWFPGVQVKNGQWYHNLQMRYESFHVPVCHSLERLEYPKRFAKTRPDFFAISPTGHRYLDQSSRLYGNLCMTNPDFRNELYKDAEAWLTGKSAASRGLTRWDRSIVRPGFFNIMPKDHFADCCCANCKKFDRADLVWDLTIDIANRLKKNGIKGYITALAYAHYRNPPKRELPDNILMMVSVRGPWADKNPAMRRDQDNRVASWYKKMGVKPWTWTALYKYGGLELPNVPSSTPRAVIHYFSRHQNDLCGAFLEAETDHWLFSFLNYYAFAKVAWDNTVSADALLNEFYTLMFGKAAKPMSEIFETIEQIWTGKIAGRTVETPLGFNSVAPTDYEVWEQLYSPEQIRKFDARIAEALKLAKNDPAALKRIRYFEQYLVGQIKIGADKYFSTRAAIADWKYTVLPVAGTPGEAQWKTAPKAFMVPYKPDSSEVRTSFQILRDSKKLYLRVECEENKMAEMLTRQTGRDNPELWRDSCVEFCFNPSGDRENYYHFVVTAKGELYDSRITASKKYHDPKWNANPKIRIENKEKSWIVYFTLSFAELGKVDVEKFAFNAARERQLKSKVELFSWSPYIKGFHDIENYGTLVFADRLPEHDNLLKNADFSAPQQGRIFGKVWFGGKKECESGVIALDTTTYRKGGKSLKITSKDYKQIATVAYFFKPILKPATTYKLTWQIRLDNVKTQGKYSGAAVNIASPVNQWYPLNFYSGTMPWTRQGWIFTTPAKNAKNLSYLRLTLRNATGTVWFDDLKLEEIKK